MKTPEITDTTLKYFEDWYLYTRYPIDRYEGNKIMNLGQFRSLAFDYRYAVYESFALFLGYRFAINPKYDGLDQILIFQDGEVIHNESIFQCELNDLKKKLLNRFNTLCNKKYSTVK